MQYPSQLLVSCNLCAADSRVQIPPTCVTPPARQPKQPHRVVNITPGMCSSCMCTSAVCAICNMVPVGRNPIRLHCSVMWPAVLYAVYGGWPWRSLQRGCGVCSCARPRAHFAWRAVRRRPRVPPASSHPSIGQTGQCVAPARLTTV